MKKIRLLPAFVTLLAGAITSITLYVLNVEPYIMLLILLAVLIIFYVLGVIAMKIIMDCPPKEQEEATEDEGEVVQKEDENSEKDDEKAKSEKK
ncbi:MAG: hypothetical protein IJ336_08230 [Lachnospiraceae bacterium]|nr:hypothetical protein [Lachnospiraceae bacterium]